MGQQSHVSALYLMDHLLLLRQVTELLGNVFFAKRSSQAKELWVAHGKRICIDSV